MAFYMAGVETSNIYRILRQ